jgi:type II secretory pathway pseudopilin PulG
MVEMVVAIGLFTTLMLIIMGSFLSVADAARKARSTRIALDNVSAALDYMGREIRLGSYFRCENDATIDTPDTPNNPAACPYGGTGGILLGFERAGASISNNTDQTVFRLQGTTIQRSLNCCDVNTVFEDLTSPEITVNVLRFYVEGTDHSAINAGDADQPRVTVVVQGVAGANKQKTRVPFALQTTLAARTPNIDPSP